MSKPSAAYSLSVRMEVDGPSDGSSVAALIAKLDGELTDLDATSHENGTLLVNFRCLTRDSSHLQEILRHLDEIEGFRVITFGDDTFRLRSGGTLDVTPRLPLETREDLSRAYTPGVARISQEVAANPASAYDLTVKGNSVAIVTDGSAVLGLGNLGPLGALPVMEGKAALFKKFGGINAWPVCLDTQDTDEIVRAVELIAPVYGGVNLEDIAAPRCFEIERRLRASLDIPVFHDDQHGTAIVVLAALLNALRVVDKSLSSARVVVLGIGAAGVAVTRLLLAEGVGDVVTLNRNGILRPDDSTLDEERAWIATHTNVERRTGGIHEAMIGADVFIGLSGPGLVTEDHLRTMSPKSIVFALANPEPEIDPHLAGTIASVVATGRSDTPNQINNALVFPGFFRGLLDTRSHAITEAMELSAAWALAAVVHDDELSPNYIIPSIFNSEVAPCVARSVTGAPIAGRSVSVA